ncbi:MAG TPA: UvrD-helicase domain-containing protein [Candidatus Pullichristensenella avicola]|nr:UvrD-helicase domain-containing protein [Candidatus Pullichristensenella avicola]
MRFTEEQTRAIRARGSDLLLSAAAGSGKTAVLVERALSLIEEGADVERMLVVTFTRAAAAEMRARLNARLGERAAENERLREQMLRLDRASITTLHGFCAEFLRANFEAAEVDPAFRVLDDAEDARMLEEAADEALEAAYAEGGEALSRLDAGRGPARVRELALRLYAFLGERPDPEAWLSQALEAKNAPVEAWKSELVRAARRAVETALAATRAALAHPGCPAHYAAAMERDVQALEDMRAVDDAEALGQALRAFKQARPSGRNRDADPEALEAVKALRKSAGDGLKRARLARLSLAQATDDALLLYQIYPALADIARRIAAEHERRKQERSGLSYADLERLTLRALARDDVAGAVREQYDFVFVDEYQDVSDLQEALIQRVSRGDNLFAVGDVKQSIYRFRLAEPRLFLRRYARYLRGEGGRLLPLTRNFRSTPPILRMVNAVFSRVMTGGDAEILYDELAWLVPGVEGGEDAPVPEVHILDEAAAEAPADEEMDEIGRAGREALWIAGRIREMMAEDEQLRYRDIAILTRAKSSVAAAMLPVLLGEGIPAYAEGLSGYFDALEVDFVLSLLRLVDNGLRDTELIGALRSCMAGLSLEELSRVRLAHPELSFADAARACAQDENALGEKLRAFFATLDGWRLRAQTVPLGELVRLVCEESGFYAYAGALPGGAQRQANLDALVTRAERFDASVSGSLTRFLDDAEHMRARGDGDSAHLLGEGDDVVRLMTIHKSKGLEFPVVFGAMTARAFRGAPGGEPLRAHRELGLGTLFVDEALRTRREPLSYLAIGEREQREDAAEEMRLLYVLLTRARRRLILVGSLRNAAARLPLFEATGDYPCAATSHLQLVVGALSAARRAGEPPAARVVVHALDELAPPRPAQEADDSRQMLRAALAGEADLPTLQALSWVYPHKMDSERPLKLTASGLLRETEGPREMPTLLERPAFLQQAGMTGAERGSAYHRVMQMLDLAMLRGLDAASMETEVRAQMQALRLAGRLSETEFSAVLPRRLARFFRGETGARLLESATVRREWPFNVRMKISEALGDRAHERYGDEEVLVQGTVDCCFVEDEAWVLLDYKTDAGSDREALARHYAAQLGIYALALERITGLRVKEKRLCLLSSGEEIVL